MQENSLQAGQRLQGNPLESHLRTFVTSLLEDGYADANRARQIIVAESFGDPVHPSTVVFLQKYAEARDRLFPASPTPAFFLSERGCRITGGTARYTFAKLSKQHGLRVPTKGSGRGPRLPGLESPTG